MVDLRTVSIDAVGTGTEWIVDASGCAPEALRDRVRLELLFATVIEALGLHPCAPAQWKVFEGGGQGVTGMLLLTESHLTVHTFPEHGVAAINLYCCRPRKGFDWESQLAHHLGARGVQVRTFARGGLAAPLPAGESDCR